MTLSEHVRIEIKSQGRKLKWVAEQIGTNYKTFISRLEKNNLSAYDMVGLIELLDLDTKKLIEIEREDKRSKSNEEK